MLSPKKIVINFLSIYWLDSFNKIIQFVCFYFLFWACWSQILCLNCILYRKDWEKINLSFLRAHIWHNYRIICILLLHLLFSKQGVVVASRGGEWWLGGIQQRLVITLVFTTIRERVPQFNIDGGLGCFHCKIICKKKKNSKF